MTTPGGRFDYITACQFETTLIIKLCVLILCVLQERGNTPAKLVVKVGQD